jgi:hypothetical protein
VGKSTVRVSGAAIVAVVMVFQPGGTMLNRPGYEHPLDGTPKNHIRSRKTLVKNILGYKGKDIGSVGRALKHAARS